MSKGTVLYYLQKSSETLLLSRGLSIIPKTPKSERRELMTN